VSVLLAEDFVVGFSIKVLLDAGGFALVQADDVVLFPHLITIDGTKSRSKTAEGRDTEDCTVLDTVIWFPSERRTNCTIDNARAAVGLVRFWEMGKILKRQVPGSDRQSQNPWSQPRGGLPPDFDTSCSSGVNPATEDGAMFIYVSLQFHVSIPG
jgi:hypothetical protein